MDEVYFQSPPDSIPPATCLRNFLTRVRWTFDADSAQIAVTASPAPQSISPSNGVITVTEDGYVDFAITYPSSASCPFAATLTTTLTIEDTEVSSDEVNINVVASSMPGGGGGDLSTPLPIEIGAVAAAANATEDSNAEAPKPAAPDPMPYIIRGFSTTSTGPCIHAAAVVCVVLDDELRIRCAANATLLPKDLFVVVLDPSVRGQDFVYQLYLVDELGAVLEVRGQPIP